MTFRPKRRYQFGRSQFWKDARRADNQSMNEPKTKSVGEALPEEIDRCQELLTQYAAIGPAGNFGAAMIRGQLKQAVEALASGDVVQMVRAYAALKECK